MVYMSTHQSWVEALWTRTQPPLVPGLALPLASVYGQRGHLEVSQAQEGDGHVGSACLKILICKYRGSQWECFVLNGLNSTLRNAGVVKASPTYTYVTPKA